MSVVADNDGNGDIMVYGGDGDHELRMEYSL